MPLNPNTQLGPYEIVALLGAGGMGEVYRARDTRLDREAAIKVLPELIPVRDAAVGCIQEAQRPLWSEPVIGSATFSSLSSYGT